MFKTLFSRMLITYLMVMLSLLILLGITLSGVFVNHYILESETKLRNECAEIYNVITEKYMDVARRNAAVEELTTIARRYDGLIQLQFNDQEYGSLTIVTNTGSNTANNKWAPMYDFYIDDSIYPSKDITSEGVILNNAYSDITTLPTMTIAQNLIYDSVSIGNLFFTVDMSETNTVINGVIVDVIIYSILGIVLGFLAVLYITDRISRPVTDMTRVVRRFTQGNFDERIEYNGEDEVGGLAQSFNQMADEINTLEAARRSFVANVSHELRSPLTSMRGFLVAMQDGTIPPEEHQKYLSIVIDENNRMTSMVNDLLDIARIESGEHVLNFEVFEIAEIIRRTLITFEARISEKHIDIEIDFSEEQIFVEADKSQIVQVLRNLIDNAIKFTPERGRITIMLRSQRRQVIVTVKDSGAGIADEDMPYVFERFYKAEKAHTPGAQAGTGLGLAIVKRIIDAHSQTISVKNDGGACFTFTLKRAYRPQTRGANFTRQ